MCPWGWQLHFLATKSPVFVWAKHKPTRIFSLKTKTCYPSCGLEQKMERRRNSSSTPSKSSCQVKQPKKTWLSWRMVKGGWCGMHFLRAPPLPDRVYVPTVFKWFSTYPFMWLTLRSTFWHHSYISQKYSDNQIVCQIFCNKSLIVNMQLLDKVCIKSPWTVVWFSQIVYFLSDYQHLW